MIIMPEFKALLSLRSIYTHSLAFLKKHSLSLDETLPPFPSLPSRLPSLWRARLFSVLLRRNENLCRCVCCQRSSTNTKSNCHTTLTNI